MCGDIKIPICIINFGDEDAHLYPEKKVGTLQEEKVTQQHLQPATAYEAICGVDEGEEAGHLVNLHIKTRF